MTPVQPAYLRDLAERYRLLANTMIDPATKGRLNALAADYDERARKAEADGRPRPAA